jgi:hypothetical protein
VFDDRLFALGSILGFGFQSDGHGFLDAAVKFSLLSQRPFALGVLVQRPCRTRYVLSDRVDSPRRLL